MDGEVNALVAVGKALYHFLYWLFNGPRAEVEAFIWRVVWVLLYIFGWAFAFRYLWYWAFQKKLKK